MTRALAVEWGARGITVNAIAPGYMMSLDGAVIYLASDASAYCTGPVLIIDGGMSVKILPFSPPDPTQREGAAAS